MEKKKEETTINVALTEEEMQTLMIHAGAVGLTAGELLQSFVSDLTHSDRSNGGDEREMAYTWYDRALLGEVHYIPERRNLLQYILLRGGLYDGYVANEIDGIIYDYDEIAELQHELEEADVDDRKCINKEIEYDKKNIDGIMREYAKFTDREVSELNQEEEIERLRRWKQEYDAHKSV